MWNIDIQYSVGEQSECSLLMLEQVLKAPDELTFSFRILRKGDS